MNVLDGLDDIRWTSLRHAYGSADDVPVVLRAIATGDADEETLQELFSSVTHQGTVYSATPETVPFLLRMLPSLDDLPREYVIEVLLVIGTAESGEPEDMEACRAAVAQGASCYLDYLRDPLPHVRQSAAKLVGMYPPAGTSVAEVLEPFISSEVDESVVLDATGVYVNHAPLQEENVRRFLLERFASGSQSQRALVGFALARSSQVEPDPAWLEAVAVELASPERDECVLEVEEVCPLLEQWSTLLRRALLRELPRAQGRIDAFAMGEALLWLTFVHRLKRVPATQPGDFFLATSAEHAWPVCTGGGAISNKRWRDAPHIRRWDSPSWDYWSRPPGMLGWVGVNVAPYLDATTLSADEEEVLRALSEHDPFWLTESDLPVVYGLPEERRDMAKLAQVKPEPRRWLWGRKKQR